MHVDATLSTGARQWSLGLDLASGRGVAFQERAAYLGVGRGVTLERGRLGARAGWRVMGGPIVQTVDQGGSFWSLAFGTGPYLGATVAVVPRWLTLGASVALDAVLLRRDGAFEPLL